MKLYTELQVKVLIDALNDVKFWDDRLEEEYDDAGIRADFALNYFSHSTPIEQPSDEEIIGKFMNWFIKHYSTAVIDGMFGYVNAIEDEVTIKEILDDYFNK